jgi:hypothetical protein
MPNLPFKALFCERFGCSPEEYEERAFRMFLYWHARFLAPLIRAVNRGYFHDDFEFIRYLGQAVDSRQAKVDVLDFKDLDRKKWGLLHSGLMIRVSGRKARRLAFQLLGKPEWSNDSAPAHRGRSAG